MQRDSIGNTIKVATLLCLVCSVLVSATAVSLRSRQEANRRRFMQQKILEVAGKYNNGDDVDALFARYVTPRVVDLVTGNYDTTIDPATYDPLKAARELTGGSSSAIENDIAGIGRRETFALVYEIGQEGRLETMILPIRGYGLWSILHGFVALDVSQIGRGPDHIAISGIAYHKHGETPGLGGEVDNPGWKAEWPGKKAYDADWNVKIEVAKGASGEYQVDALSGATITSRGVSNMLSYWLGREGFLTFLQKSVAPQVVTETDAPDSGPESDSGAE